jgi:hypothetical protein
MARLIAFIVAFTYANMAFAQDEFVMLRFSMPIGHLDGSGTDTSLRPKLAFGTLSDEYLRAERGYQYSSEIDLLQLRSAVVGVYDAANADGEAADGHGLRTTGIIIGAAVVTVGTLFLIGRKAIMDGAKDKSDNN